MDHRVASLFLGLGLTGCAGLIGVPDLAYDAEAAPSGGGDDGGASGAEASTLAEAGGLGAGLRLYTGALCCADFEASNVGWFPEGNGRVAVGGPGAEGSANAGTFELPGPRPGRHAVRPGRRQTLPPKLASPRRSSSTISS